ncbi:MAG: hypothetical protein RBS22_09850 [Spongiibacteraceae bacterium]|jgi:hypothetical protein|nr:hypothetical protein [Spongiibacteraceae bacterium]
MDMTETTAGSVDDAKARRGDRRRLWVQGGWHLAAALVAIGVWAALDSWRLLTGLSIASGLSVLAAVAAGMWLSHQAHEWSHFLGARLCRAVSPVKSQPAFLIYDYDFSRNTPEQFLVMSVAGSLGNLALALLIAIAIPMDSAGRAMLLAAVIAMAVYVALLEFPVIHRAWRERNPLAALQAGFTPAAFNRATVAAIAAGLVVWGLLLPG